jgi:hypothetical protein
VKQVLDHIIEADLAAALDRDGYAIPPTSLARKNVVPSSPFTTTTSHSAAEW